MNNLQSSDHYDILVIGGGAGGLTTAAVATNLGAKTALIESDKLGGDCTWGGCVPSKALLKSANVAHQMKHGDSYGVRADGIEVDFEAVMNRVRRIRQEVYEDADHPRHFEEMGITVMEGRASFVSEQTVRVEKEASADLISGRYIVIATGTRARIPPISGLDNVAYLTNHSLFELDEQPSRLAIIGAGPVGTEMAQAFNRLGTDVTVLEQEKEILSNDDPELTQILRKTLEDEGVNYRLGATVEQVTETERGAKINLGSSDIDADAVLVAAGRTGNTDHLNLEAAGINSNHGYIPVDDHCRTNQSHIYAVGDVTGRYQFTHMSEHMGKVAAANALLKWPMTVDEKHVPWVTYTEPELAHVGETGEHLEERDATFATYRFPYSKLDRAITEGRTTGLVKVFARKWNGRIMGASVLGARAGELISELVSAMRNGTTLRNLADTIHPYPSYGRAVRRVADQWYGQKQSATFTQILQTVFGYSGPVIEPDPDRIL